MQRSDSAQRRRVKAPKPPMSVARTYRDLIWARLEKFNARILEEVTKDWARNPAAHGPGPVPRSDAVRSTFVVQMIHDLEVALEEAFNPQDLAGELDILATRINKHGLLEFRRVIGISSTDLGVRDLLSDFRTRNVSLIKSLAKEQISEIRGLLQEGEAGAWQVDELRKSIQARFGVTRSKADLLARDQTLKLNGQLTQKRQQNAGIVEYIWTTSRDERVRPMHAELEGTKQRWDKPPVVSPDGRRGHPGDDYQCRCTAFPVLEELDGETADE